jgi:hypothetical protein
MKEKTDIWVIFMYISYISIVVFGIIMAINGIKEHGFIKYFSIFISENPRISRLIISFLLLALSILFDKILGKIFIKYENYKNNEIMSFIVVIICLFGTIFKMPLIVFCIIGIILLCLTFLLLEILIGKLIGKTLSEKSGLVLGIVLIILGVTLFIGIPVIIYSSDKYMYLRKNKFIGKNYIDILTENGLQEYIPLFEKNKLTDINIISELTEDDYQKIGINIMGDRKKILKLFSLE